MNSLWTEHFGSEATPPRAARGDDLRFHCESRERPKRKGKLLKKALDARGYGVPLSKCHDLMARMYGFRNLNDLYDHVGLFRRSPSDEDVDQAAFERRFWWQVDKLTEFGVSAADAEDVVDGVRPTGGAHPSHAHGIRLASGPSAADFGTR
ncbi:hypothetical protein JQ554_23260 [Bradyrhizobium diazoefficiens]|nr:hypothetical protein [Bradyrhizobium diazoefficiens]MBR0966970.1 hypothetical protein [Bradyrhizobium diazoefficiens]MBR0980608.1 hypothetical protein [Bradyrhizobium diazoefficiens]MBR1009956.1 hypothetical protein [Bradyrhizobium diazoefficiens]MBR1016539.1 hypothetical protein [Bradyrhizobium diazoefficiens]MBR1053794.1 hypothetical protein [Bradyrhizobium diazoefficiens]